VVIRRASRSPLQRALIPVLGGLGFFALLGLATWGIAAVLANNPQRVNETLAATTFEVGTTSSMASIIAESGPLIFPDLMRAGGTRTVVLDHTGTEDRLGWQAYYAYPADRDLSCKVTQIHGTRTFKDCNGRTIEVEQLAPPVGVVVAVGDTVIIDLTAATAAASGTTVAPSTSEAP